MALTGRRNRQDYFSPPAEDLLGTMDDVYSLLVTIDYPDALTRSLRRNTDMLRSVPERTRGDLTPRPPPTPPRTTPLPPPRPNWQQRSVAPQLRRFVGAGFKPALPPPQDAAPRISCHKARNLLRYHSPCPSTLSCLLLPLLEVDIDSYRASRSGTGNEEELTEYSIVEQLSEFLAGCLVFWRQS